MPERELALADGVSKVNPETQPFIGLWLVRVGVFGNVVVALSDTELRNESPGKLAIMRWPGTAELGVAASESLVKAGQEFTIGPENWVPVV